MSAKELPARANLDQYKKQAKDLVKARKSGNPQAFERIKDCHPRFAELSDPAIAATKFALADGQLVIAREHSFDSWPKFAKHIEALANARAAAEATDLVADFIVAACSPREAGHASGTLDRAEAILSAHPEVATANIHTAAILGDDATVRRFLALNPRNATAKGGPHGWDALTHLCFSRYLRIDRARSAAFVRSATALLDAGANPNTGWMETNHQPRPEWESAIYGAAGVAHHADLTRLLLDRGADPNDEETPYHAPESYDNDALKVLVESGKLNNDSLGMILLRKTDWHDFDGIKWLLEHHVDPNASTRWGKTALHNAILSDNSAAIIEILLEHGADPTLTAERPDRGHALSPRRSAIAMAARRGRGDLLELFEGLGFLFQVVNDNVSVCRLQSVDRLIAACARNKTAEVRTIADEKPELVHELLAEGGKLLAEFAGNGNTEGVRHLLNLGVGVTALYEGDGYFDIAKDSTALHVAAWRAWPSTVKLLIERGAPVNALDGNDRSLLTLAVRACVDSYWKYRRTPESVEALLRAGAFVAGIHFPCGYSEVDALLVQHGATPRA